MTTTAPAPSPLDALAERLPATIRNAVREAVRANPDALRDLLDYSTAALPLAPFPSLRTVDGLDEDDEPTRTLVCPRCRAHLDDEGGVVAVDLSERRTYATDARHDARGGLVTFDYDETSDYQGAHYQCGSCDRPVSLPDGYREA